MGSLEAQLKPSPTNTNSGFIVCSTFDQPSVSTAAMFVLPAPAPGVVGADPHSWAGQAPPQTLLPGGFLTMADLF